MTQLWILYVSIIQTSEKNINNTGKWREVDGDLNETEEIIMYFYAVLHQRFLSVDFWASI